MAAGSGDLGYTTGRWRLVDPASDSPTGSGHYVTIGRRRPDGTWKVAIDIGNEDSVPR